MVGGMAVTEELWPGFKCPTLAHAGGPIRAEIMRDMGLERYGLRMTKPDVRLCALSADNSGLLIYDDPAKTAAELSATSPEDAKAYAQFQEVLGRFGRMFHLLAGTTPPSVDHPSAMDLLRLLKTARQVRRLGRREMYRLLRWGPMPVSDLMDEWFQTPLLKAVIAGRAIFGCNAGPRSPATSSLLLIRSGDDAHAAGPSAFPIGGMGVLAEAMGSAASAAGANIRTGAEVAAVEVRDGSVSGVWLKSGEQIAATTVISNADPVRTLLGLVDPVHLPPNFLLHVQQYRSSGVLAKVNLALDGLPGFTALERMGSDGRALSGRIHIGPSMDYLERAFDASKYGEFSREPFLDILIPTVADPSLAPAGKHVMSIYAQFAPYKLRAAQWPARADDLGDSVVETLAAYAPDLPDRILHRQVITPADLEERYGLTGGHIFHGELSLEQFFTMRPLLGWARYRTPIRGLYLCGSGTHPGSGLTGASGANAAREIVSDLR
jgi:phytoene dehydrogenase-like protein